MTTTAIKERPILFSGEMVRAILAGEKTVTRRVVKHKWLKGPCDIRDIGNGPEIYAAGGVWLPLPCPYGEPGDRLWVRETWQAYLDDPVFEYRANVFYRADESDPETLPISGSWRPSIHMPRWASRITLEVKSVRVERLQEITHEDALAEGCEGYDWVSSSPYISGPHTDSGELPQEEFAALWDELNADRGYSWESNPWVWRVEFERIKGDTTE